MISLKDISVQQGDFRLENININIEEGDYCCLMGYSGCGKTTLMEIICGLRPFQSGKVYIDGRDVTDLPPRDRGIGFVPQEGVAFKHKTTFQNIAFPLELRGYKNDEIQDIVHRLAKQFHIEKQLFQRSSTLSGGERQRMSIARAISFSPSLLLLDEPLASIDERAKEEIIEILLDLKSRRNITTLHITHSAQESRRLGDYTIDIFGNKQQ